MEREKGRGCLATRRLPWPETCGTETGIKKEQLHDDGQGDESGVMDEYTASRFPHVRNIKMFVICLFQIPLLRSFGPPVLS